MKDNDSVEVGGENRLPAYPHFYYEAARRLLESSSSDLEPVALPLIYLQRHCVELAIKEIHLASLFLSNSIKSAKEGRLLPPSWPIGSHCLVDLINQLATSLDEHQIRVPPELQSIAVDMDALEESAPDKYRYAFHLQTKEQKRKGHGPDASFPTPRRLPVHEFQRRLALIVKIVDYHEPESLVMKLYSKSVDALNEGGGLQFDD